MFEMGGSDIEEIGTLGNPEEPWRKTTSNKGNISSTCLRPGRRSCLYVVMKSATSPLGAVVN